MLGFPRRELEDGLGSLFFRGGRAGTWSCMVWFWDVDSLIFLFNTIIITITSPCVSKTDSGHNSDTSKVPTYVRKREREERNKLRYRIENPGEEGYHSPAA